MNVRPTIEWYIQTLKSIEEELNSLQKRSEVLSTELDEIYNELAGKMMKNVQYHINTLNVNFVIYMSPEVYDLFKFKHDEFMSDIESFDTFLGIPVKRVDIPQRYVLVIE